MSLSRGRIEKEVMEHVPANAGREPERDGYVCLGMVDGRHCPIRVSCRRYQELRPDSKEFVRIKEFSDSMQNEFLGCEKHEVITSLDMATIVNGLKKITTPDDYEEWR